MIAGLKRFFGVTPKDPPPSMETMAAQMRFDDLQRRVRILKEQARTLKRRDC